MNDFLVLVIIWNLFYYKKTLKFRVILFIYVSWEFIYSFPITKVFPKYIPNSWVWFPCIKISRQK